jgi:essential nuclear protein 1
MPKKTRSRTGQQNRHDPLASTIDADGKRHLVQQKAKKYSSKKNNNSDETSSSSSSSSVPAKLSRKIMKLAQQQQEDLGEGVMLRLPGSGASSSSSFQNDEFDDNDSDDDEFDTDLIQREGDYIGAGEMNEAEEAALSQFMPKQSNQMQTLGDIIAEKIREREEAERDAAFETGGDGKSTGTNPNGSSIQYSRGTSEKVIEVYSRVGTLLTRYRAGKVPKAFKIIPALRNWEEVLMITNPEKWSPHAMYVATKIFASNLNPKNAQRFYNLILLPAVRDDIRKEKKVNYHLYRSLKKAIYKPAAFFKGILLPLCDKREGCTLREAMIIGSVLAKVSIPMMHSAAALLKMCMMPYSGVTSLFMTVLLDKKYALPYRVVDAVVGHFLGFQKETKTLPLMWHKCLLIFSQRYKQEITAEQKNKLKLLLRTHSHHIVTGEIRRELFNARSRGDNKDRDVQMGE